MKSHHCMVVVVFLLLCGLHNEAANSKFWNGRQYRAHLCHPGGLGPPHFSNTRTKVPPIVNPFLQQLGSYDLWSQRVWKMEIIVAFGNMWISNNPLLTPYFSIQYSKSQQIRPIHHIRIISWWYGMFLSYFGTALHFVVQSMIWPLADFKWNQEKPDYWNQRFYVFSYHS